MKRLLRVALVGIVASGALGYGAIANQAHAAYAITLQLQLTIRCDDLGETSPGNCLDTGATLDGSFVGFSGAPSPPAGYPCNEPWYLDQLNGTQLGPDGLWGRIICNGPGIPQVSVEGGYGRFAGYTAPPTAEPTFAYVGADTGAVIPPIPPNGIPVCGKFAQISCPVAGYGTGLVLLTLTKTT
jgi:hypothetical protein